MKKLSIAALGLGVAALLFGATLNGWLDMAAISIPANPSAGGRLFYNSGTSKLDCVTSTGASCSPSTSGAEIAAFSGMTVCNASHAGYLSFLSDSVYSPVLCDGAARHYLYRGREVTLPGVVSGWTQVGSSTGTTISDQNGAITVTVTDTANTLRGIVKAASGTFTRTFVWQPAGQAKSSSSEVTCGVLLSDGTNFASGKQIAFVYSPQSATQVWKLGIFDATNASFTGAYFAGSTGAALTPGSPLWFRVGEVSAGNRTFSYSADGVNYTTIDARAASTQLTTAFAGFGCWQAPASGDVAAATLIGVQ